MSGKFFSLFKKEFLKTERRIEVDVKIPFSDITERGTRLVITETAWSADSGMTFTSKPKAELSLFLLNEITVSLKGNLKAAVILDCGRCGCAVPFTVDEPFDYIFRVEEDSSLSRKEVECSDEDCETVFLEEPVIDVKEVLLEQLILSVPEKLLCSEQCRGLCPQCGASLNNGQCGCAEKQPDSPFAVLKHLKK